MKFGLNTTKKKVAPVINKALMFSQHDEEDDEEEGQEQQGRGAGSNAKNKKNQQKKQHLTTINQQLSGYKTITKKIAEEHQKALEEDPNIFDYDAVYDDLKEAEKQQKEAMKSTDTKKARYINNLLEMAEIRKRDRLLAEEKKVAREREAEGDEFADKEAFQTETYKKQKEELMRIEAEEKEREEQMQKSKTMSSFYKQVLDKKEAAHKHMMDAMAKKSSGSRSAAAGADKAALDTEGDVKLAEEARREGKSVMLNDNNEIVDKRELLGAGLNVKPKFGSFGSLASTDERVRERQNEYEEYKRKKVAEYEARKHGHGQHDERERLSREIERQMIEQQEREKEEEEKKQKELEAKATAKRTTDESAMSARDRYLARKKQKIEEEGAGKAI
ncbi:coiled-coil domain-containing protein 55-domain containing protein [Phycomyces blakesleeanus]|uniref:Coiled-coil domain-containing protein 55-domain containing protein n=1 Tax=Phycomyces blakesleeanus TaxID=4837 RepID=A0ABR3BCU9_PHYBL